jgi:hypothetical protein
MARQNKIWFRKDVGWWMVTLGGKKVRLVQRRESRKAAEQKFHELKTTLARSGSGSELRVADITDRFLEWAKIHRNCETMRNFACYGQKFTEHIGYLPAHELRPNHLTQFFDRYSRGQTTQRNGRWASNSVRMPNSPCSAWSN